MKDTKTAFRSIFSKKDASADGEKGSSGASMAGKKSDMKKIWCDFFSCIAASWGGFIYGFDIGLSGGVLCMNPFLKKFFPCYYSVVIGDESVNQSCDFRVANDEIINFTCCLFVGALIASPFGTFLRRKLGRRIARFISGLIFLIGALISAAAMNRKMLIGGRFSIGMAFGLTDQCCGALNIFFQLMFSLGIMSANLLTFGANNINADWGWRLSMAISAVPGGLIVIGACIMPETLNSIIARNDPETAKRIIRKIRGSDDVDEEFNDLVKNSVVLKEELPWIVRVTPPGENYTPYLILAYTISGFQSFCGAIAFMLYSPILFRTLGFGNNASLFSSGVVYFVNFLATVISLYLLDKKGMKRTLILGGVQMLTFLLLAGILVGVGTIDGGFAFWVVICICGYIAGFAWSWGPVGWFLRTDVAPPELQKSPHLRTLFFHLMITALVSLYFPPILFRLGYGTFFLFAAMVALLTLIIWRAVPETEGLQFDEACLV